MGISVYNTLSRKKEAFEPVQPGKVGMYVCGPTVYSKSHIGHMVGPVIFDTIKRYLEYRGFQVTLVINITDIDDKIIVQAGKEKVGVKELAERVTADYLANLEKLGVRVDHFPRATDHIPEMLAMMQGLIDKDFAYAAGGDVYFDVTKMADYGKLSNRKLDELLAGVRKETSDLKRNPGDFAMWKGAKAGEPAWDSPWGPGRPGWHIECSAMSLKYLGETFDIHGGGLDLCFPHHEDEIAQSECYTGKTFAKYWMHNGLMQYSDATRKIGAREGDYSSQESAKMSKSKGNVITITDLLAKHPPETIRFFLLSTHYRRPIDFSDERIAEVAKGLERLQLFADRVGRVLKGKTFYQFEAPARHGALPFKTEGSEFLGRVAELRERFLQHMDDDFNTGGAIGVLFELAPVLNRFADEKKLEGEGAAAAEVDAFSRGVGVLRELTAILGVLAAPPAAASLGGGDGYDEGLTAALLDLFLEVRQTARQTKNFAMSDLIRDRLKALGVVIEDSPAGSRWRLERKG